MSNQERRVRATGGNLWVALGFALALSGAAVLSLFNLLSASPQDPDEGVYLIVARILNHGYPPSSFYFDQLDFFPKVLALALRVGGDNLLTGRLTIFIFSLTSLLLLAFLTRALSTRLSAFLVIPIAIVNPWYLQPARITLAEIPSITFMLGALLAILWYARNGKRAWLIASGVCFVASLLIKPLMFFFGLALVWMLVARASIRQDGKIRVAFRPLLFDLFLFATACWLTLLPFVNLSNLTAEFERTVGFHLGEVQFFASSPLERQQELSEFLATNLAWWGLASLGALALTRRMPGTGIALLLSEILSALLLVQLPPFSHHYAILVPILAFFSALGLDSGVNAWKDLVSSRRLKLGTGSLGAPERSTSWITGILFMASIGLGLFGAQRFIISDYIILTKMNRFRENVTVTQQYVQPDEFAISDDPLSLYIAGGMLPPSAINFAYVSTFGVDPNSFQLFIASLNHYDVKDIIVTSEYKKNGKLMQFIRMHFPLVAVPPRSGIRVYLR